MASVQYGSVLQEISTTFSEMAAIAARELDNFELSSFYCHVAANCCDLQYLLQGATHVDSQSVSRVLLCLGSAVPPRVELTSMAKIHHALQDLSRRWILLQDDNARAAFTREIWSHPESSREQRRRIDEDLKRHMEELRFPQSEDSDVKPRTSSIDETSFFVTTAAGRVFDALQSLGQCECSHKGGFGVKLGLGTYAQLLAPIKPPKPNSLQAVRHQGQENTPDGIKMGVFVSMESRWHEFRVLATRKTCIDRRNPEEGVGAERNRESSKQSQSQALQALCEELEMLKDIKYLRYLRVELMEGRLFKKEYEKTDFFIHQEAEAVSLAQLIEDRPELFTEKIKRILSVLVGCAVFHLDKTSWLSPAFDSTSIKFFRTISEEIPLRPFVETQLDDKFSENLASGTEWSHNSIHLCPALISLAVVLMELCFVKSFQKLADVVKVELMPKENNEHVSLIDAWQVFKGVDSGNENTNMKGLRSEIPDNSCHFRSAIDNCLDARLWEAEDGSPLSNITLKSRIRQMIIRPLELHLICGFKEFTLRSVDDHARGIDLAKWGRPIAAKEPMKNSCDHITVQRPEYSCYKDRAAQFFDDELCVDPKKNEDYAKWLSAYKEIYSKFIAGHEPDSSKPVKIAVLDTGIDEDHSVFCAHNDITKKINFYNLNKRADVKDTHGHGTFVTSLVLDYSPDADVHVIKISDRDNASPNAKIVKAAIDHAVNVWEVDIISMSFGWPSTNFDGYEELENAIDNAYSKQVLMFAAASNNGGNSGRAYPASSSHVICVHSTDTRGNRSDFSPTAWQDCVNIATVGESVWSAWATQPGDSKLGFDRYNSRSGTSYATAILVGIAASLLRFGRLHLGPEDADEMKRKSKMEGVLKACATDKCNTRSGYYYVQLSLLKTKLFEEPERDARAIFNPLGR